MIDLAAAAASINPFEGFKIWLRRDFGSIGSRNFGNHVTGDKITAAGDVLGTIVSI